MTEKRHIKDLYPQVAEALEELFNSDKTKFRNEIKQYRGYKQPEGRIRRLSLDAALSLLADNGYDIEIKVVTKAEARLNRIMSSPLPA